MEGEGNEDLEEDDEDGYDEIDDDGASNTNNGATGIQVNIQAPVHNLLLAGKVDGGMGNTIYNSYNHDIEQSSSEDRSLAEDAGIMDQDTMDLFIKETKNVFVETSAFKKVEDILEKHGHVTISAASGEGKTSIALMLGVKYREKGYKLILVNDIDKFKLKLRQDKGLFLLFDDIFGSVGLSTDVPHLKNLLQRLRLGLENSRSDSVALEGTEQNPVDCGKKMYFVFTTKTYNLESCRAKLGQEFYFFKVPALLEMTREHANRYSLAEKKSIFMKHKDIYILAIPSDCEEICTSGNDMFGFPLTCSLFFKFEKFQEDVHKFFKEPLIYLKYEISRILHLKNEQSAALILMLLCDGNLNLRHIEIPSDNELIDSNIKNVESIVEFKSRSDIATAARRFRGTFFTEGDIISFAHPQIYDACACVLFKINPSFTLMKCSLKFLYERVQVASVQSTEIDEHHHIIYVTDVYHDIIVSRLAEGIKKGIFNVTIAHPILKESVLVDNLFEKLKCRKINWLDRIVGNKKTKRETVLHRTHDGEYLLQWAMLAQSLYLVEKILSIGYRFTKREILGSLYTCSRCGNNLVMKHLLKTYKSVILVKHLNQALTWAMDNNNMQGVTLLVKQGATYSNMTTERKKKLFICSVQEENINMCQILITEILGDWKNSEEVSKAFRRSTNDRCNDLCNEMLEIGCQYNNFTLVDLVASFSDINSIKGKHGHTRLMDTVVYHQHDLFYLLVTKKADLTLTDNYGDTVLHLACHGGNKSIVEHLLPSYDINCRGQNGWTPVVNAAYSGKQDVFDLLVTKGADLTLTDDNGNKVLHLACRGGNTSIVEHLLQSFDINIPGENDLTPVMNAAYSDKKEVFDLLLAKRADVTLTYNCNTALHLACWGGNTAIVKHLLPLFDINVSGKHALTPVMNAAYSGKKKVFDLLVTEGADLTLTDNYSNTVLHLACQGGNTAIVEHLLSAFDINIPGEDGWTPVMNAAYSDKKEVFDLLLTKGADMCRSGNYGFTLLQLASQGGNKDIVKQCLSSFTIDSRGIHGWSAIMMAAFCSQVSAFDFLYKSGAGLCFLDNYGDSLIHLASHGGNANIVRQILNLYSHLNIRGHIGWTPIMRAAVTGQVDVFNMLCDMGADLEVTDDIGDDLLYLAIQGGNINIIKTLSECPGNQSISPWTQTMKDVVSGYVNRMQIADRKELTKVDSYGDSVLHLACRGGNKSCVEQLLPCYDINVGGRYGWTPLMMAARCGHLEVFQYVMAREADLSLVSDKGEDVLTLAQGGRHKDIVTYLLSLPMFKDRT